MRSSGRGVEHVDLDHLDWVEDAPRRPRSGADRRAAERRRAAAQAPAPERRSSERRSGERRAPADDEPARRARDADAQTRRRTAPRRAARPPATILGPGVAERRALMLITFLLVVYGLVMAYSASAAQAYFEHGSSFYFFGRQVVWVCLGVATMYVLSRVDYAWFRKAAVPLAGLALAGLLLVLVPGVGSTDQRRSPLAHPRRPGRAAQRVRQARRRRARRGAHRAAAARGPDAAAASCGSSPSASCRRRRSSCSSPTSGPRSCW